MLAPIGDLPPLPLSRPRPPSLDLTLPLSTFRSPAPLPTNGISDGDYDENDICVNTLDLSSIYALEQAVKGAKGLKVEAT